MSLIKEHEDNYISVVVYIHNSESNLQNFLEKITKLFNNAFKSLEYIFVDDSSKDKSLNIIKHFFGNSKEQTATIINMSYYQGLELSMSAGVELAIGDYVFEFDSTVLSFDCNTIMDVYKKCLEGNDIVAATPNGHFHSLSKLYYYIFSKFSYNQHKMETEAFRILSRRAINRIYSMTCQIPFRKAAYVSSGLSMERVNYDVVGEYPKIKKQERREKTGIGIDALILYTDVAYRLGMGFSIFMIIFSAICIIYIVLVYLAGKPVPGYVSTFAISAFGFFGVCILLSILIKYASLILRIVFQKKRYLINSIERL